MDLRNSVVLDRIYIAYVLCFQKSLTCLFDVCFLSQWGSHSWTCTCQAIAPGQYPLSKGMHGLYIQREV